MREEMTIDKAKSLIEKAFVFYFPLVLMDITKEISNTFITKPPVHRPRICYLPI